MNTNLIAVAFLRVKFLETIAVEILKFFNSIVGNYGLAIILTTLLIKALLFPVTLKQEKSMQMMKELQPEIDEIQKKYKGDKAKINEMTAQLYREKNVNPFSSCLPFIKSITASACDKSILPFIKALLVNSPLSAILAPFFNTN